MIIKKKCNKADGNYLSTDTTKINLLGWVFTSSCKVTIRVLYDFIFFIMILKPIMSHWKRWIKNEFKMDGKYTRGVSKWYLVVNKGRRK